MTVAGIVSVVGINILAVDTMGSTDYTMPAILGQLIILFTTIAGFLYTIYRENRNRKWDLEDRKQAREVLVQQMNAHQENTMNKIDENTAATNETLEKANNVDKRIDTLVSSLDKVKGRTTVLEDTKKNK